MVRHVVIALALFAAGCRAASAGRAAPPDRGELRFEGVHQLAGRPFALFYVPVPDPSEISSPPMIYQAVLCILGDDRRISLGSTLDPTTVSVRGDSIEFGGQTLTVTATPGTYLLDGTQVVLPVGGVHVFFDGEWLGTDPGDLRPPLLPFPAHPSSP